MYKTTEIVRWENDQWLAKDDQVVEEYPLTLYINQEEWMTLLCSPDELEALIIGYLRSEGVIRKASEITEILLDLVKGHGWVTIPQVNDLAMMLHGKRTQTTGCGKGMTFYHVLDTVDLQSAKGTLEVSMDKLSDLMRTFNQSSTLFQETGGVHSCALCSAEEIIWLMDDIGRHNALDKLIGKALLENLPLDDKLLLTSGRISSEILLKCARAGISTIISRSAPTHLAVEEAKRLNMTLVGFLRGRKGNVYHGLHRIRDLQSRTIL